MITELSVSPRPANKSAVITFGALLFSAAITTVLYLTAERFRGVIGLLAIAFITAAVLIYTRYIAVKYYYDVTFDSSSPVIEESRMQQSVLARLPISCLTVNTAWDEESKVTS